MLARRAGWSCPRRGRLRRKRRWTSFRRTDVSGSGPRYEAAVFIQLMPGTYTVTLSGKAAAEGVGLVEVYQIQE